MTATPNPPGPGSPVGDDPERLRLLAVALAREAAATAARLRPGAVEPGRVRTKSSDTDVVTAADTATERLLRERLAALRPGDAILGEEGQDDDSAGPGNSPIPARPGRWLWLLDPIDGTVNYLHGLPWYAVSVAVARDGVTQAGAVAEPASGRMWSAALGGGAELDGRPLRVSSADRLELALIGTGFSYSRQRRARQGTLAGELLPRVGDLRRVGSAALDLCAVGAGWLDGYYEHATNPWDWAAGALVAAEAGALVSPPDPDAPWGDAMVAATPGIHPELTDTLVRLGAARV